MSSRAPKHTTSKSIKPSISLKRL